jgi:hypothetical protein
LGIACIVTTSGSTCCTRCLNLLHSAVVTNSYPAAEQHRFGSSQFLTACIEMRRSTVDGPAPDDVVPVKGPKANPRATARFRTGAVLASAILACLYFIVPSPPALHQGSSGDRSRSTQSEVVTSPKAEQAASCVPADWPANVIPPGIFAVGHTKTGSTYLNGLLNQHPQIARAATKEINFFSEPGDEQPISAYAAFFPNRSSDAPDAITMDLSIVSASHMVTRDRLRRAFPCGKIVFFMRDPTVRWWSWYNHQYRRCVKLRRPSCDSVEVVYQREMKKTLQKFDDVGFTPEVQASGTSFFLLQRLNPPAAQFKNSGAEPNTFASGMYYSRIKEWLEVWPRSQVLLINTEEYFNPDTLNDRMRVITDFAGLKPHTFTAIPPRLPARFGGHKAPGDYGALPEPIYSQIREFYAPDLKLLKQHFGISFNVTKTGMN